MHATAFADEQVKLCKAMPAERDAIAALFLQAAKADTDGKMLFSADGKLVEGDNLATVRKLFADRPAHALSQNLTGQIPEGTKLIVLSNTPSDAPSAERTAELVKMTPVGRGIAQEAK